MKAEETLKQEKEKAHYTWEKKDKIIKEIVDIFRGERVVDFVFQIRNVGTGTKFTQI